LFLQVKDDEKITPYTVGLKKEELTIAYRALLFYFLIYCISKRWCRRFTTPLLF